MFILRVLPSFLNFPSAFSECILLPQAEVTLSIVWKGQNRESESLLSVLRDARRCGSGSPLLYRLSRGQLHAGG